MRHSDLINASDLHFSKFRTFSGSPTLIAPNFVDQILAATDTNKVYRATGITQGALIEMVVGGQDGNPPNGQSYTLVSTFSGSPTLIVPDFIDQLFAAIDTNKIYRATGINQGDVVELAPSPSVQEALISGSNYPFVFPSFLGQQYFDQATAMLFFAKGLSVADWRPVHVNMSIEINISIYAGSPSNSFNLYYSPENPVDGFNFTNLVATGLFSGSNPANPAIPNAGIGYYALVQNTPDPTAIVASSTSPIYDSIYSNTIFETESLTGSFTANGQAISSEVLRFVHFPRDMTSFQLSFEVNAA